MKMRFWLSVMRNKIETISPFMSFTVSEKTMWPQNFRAKSHLSCSLESKFFNHDNLMRGSLALLPIRLPAFFRISRHFNTSIGIVDWSQISNISVKYWACWNHYIRAHLWSKFNWPVGRSGSIFCRDIWDFWLVYNTNWCIEVPQDSKKMLVT